MNIFDEARQGLQGLGTAVNGAAQALGTVGQIASNGFGNIISTGFHNAFQDSLIPQTQESLSNLSDSYLGPVAALAGHPITRSTNQGALLAPVQSPAVVLGNNIPHRAPLNSAPPAQLPANIEWHPNSSQTVEKAIHNFYSFQTTPPYHPTMDYNASTIPSYDFETLGQGSGTADYFRENNSNDSRSALPVILAAANTFTVSPVTSTQSQPSPPLDFSNSPYMRALWHKAFDNISQEITSRRTR